MVVTEALLNEKIDNLQHQIDTMRRESDAFKPHVNGQVSRIDQIYQEMAIKKDMEHGFDRIDATLKRMNNRLEDHGAMIAKIAEKLGVA